jgi:hypothetical protein
MLRTWIANGAVAWGGLWLTTRRAGCCKRSNLLWWARGLPVCVPLILCILLLYRDNATDNNLNFFFKSGAHTSISLLTRKWIRHSAELHTEKNTHISNDRNHDANQARTQTFSFGGGGAGVAQMLRSYIIYVWFQNYATKSMPFMLHDSPT